MNLAHGLGFARDPEENADTHDSRNTKGEERRRLIWWDIMSYDTYVYPPLLIFLTTEGTN